jgi:hypothetical protein
MATYPVRCECGKTHQVPGSAAGSTIACDCRRTVEIPSYAKLKASVGESSVSADFVIPLMLANKELPVETDCVACCGKTDHQIDAMVICDQEQSKEKKSLTWYEILLLPFVTFSNLWLFVLAFRKRQGDVRKIGADVMFRLPIRLCEKCAPEVHTTSQIRSALSKTDLYRQLLDKYPMARIER